MMTKKKPASLVPFLKTDQQGQPFLEGCRCRSCGHTFVGEQMACAKCTTRGKLETIKLSETGKLYVYTIIYRSFPGVETPFIDAIVNLDDGAHLKGTLHGIDFDPNKIPFDLPVRVVYQAVTPPNRPGETFLTYAFEPAGQGGCSV